MTRKDAGRASEVLGLRAINRAYMARQLMIERPPMPVADAIEHLVGLQGQGRPGSLHVAVVAAGRVRPGRARSAGRGPLRGPDLADAGHDPYGHRARRPLPCARSSSQSCERVLRQSSPFARAVAGIDETALFEAGRTMVEESP